MQVLKRDNYTCKICGRSPVTNPGLFLEVDHVIPFSCNGLDDLSNFQTLCIECNRGKGNTENLNKLAKNDLDIVFNSINPEILKNLQNRSNIRVVVNQEEFAEIIKKNSYGNFYEISIIPNTLIGYHAGYNLGIYTVNDNGGSKVNFFIYKKK